jgi:peptide/nickel transport system substrate-binding protein
MGRYIRWQALIALSGIILVGVFLFSIALSRTTVLVPDEGGIYVEGVAGVPQYVNPLLAQYNQVDQDLVALIFNGLTRADGQGELEPDLASSWTISPDGLTYLFRLRQDVRWSDGEAFDADDVLFTVGLMQDPDFPGVPYLTDLWRTVSVEKVDAHTVRFGLNEPFPPFADYTTIGILPEHVLSRVSARELLTHPFNAHPIGTGPFLLEDITAERALLIPNPRYTPPKGKPASSVPARLPEPASPGTDAVQAGGAPRREQPYLAGIEFRFYPTYERLLTAYRAGEIQGISNIPPYLLPEAAQLASLNLYNARLSDYQIGVYLNLQDSEESPFFQDARVRRALLHALDRQALIDEALNGQGIVANGPIRPWSWAFDPDTPPVAYDPAQAQTLLAEAGWLDTDGDGIRDKNSQPLQFILLTGDTPAFARLGQAMAAQWARQGIGVEVETLGAGLSDRLRSRNFQAVLVELLLSGDPDPYPLWHQTQIEGGQNYGSWDNREASEALEQARYVTDRGQRKNLYVQFQRIFAEETPALIIAYPTYTYAIDQSVRNVQIGPMVSPSDRFRNIADWYMNTRRVILAEAQYRRPASQSRGE